MKIIKCNDGIHSQTTIHETIEELLHYLLYTPDDNKIIPALINEPINEFMSEDLQKRILEILKCPEEYGISFSARIRCLVKDSIYDMESE